MVAYCLEYVAYLCYLNSMKITIQIYIAGKWITAGEFDLPDAEISKGIGGAGYFEYETDYAIAGLVDELPYKRVGLRYPVNFELYAEKQWFAFLLDILPSGAGRRVWARRLDLPDNQSSDWQLLLHGAGNPPGNIRVKEAVIEHRLDNHPGFDKEDIISKQADFIEYAESMGAVVAGATDVAGDAPKFLISRDHNGRWHPDGGLADKEIMDSWLVKFPRGKELRDKTVLRNEAPYYEVARHFGIRTGKPLEFIGNALFIPRFDRKTGNPFVRHGLETLASAAGIATYGRRGNHLELCQAIVAFSSSPLGELFEYLSREILNCALRNTDNHPRNTSLIKYAEDRIELSPLYDFAPMFLDPEGISRATRWEGMEITSGRPDWSAIAAALGEWVSPDDTVSFLKSHVVKVAVLPECMKKCGVEDEVIEGVVRRCGEIADDLSRVGSF